MKKLATTRQLETDKSIEKNTRGSEGAANCLAKDESKLGRARARDIE